MRKCVLVAVAVATLALAADARAFGTLNSLGQHAEHERITRAALTDFDGDTLDELAGERGSFGAVGSPDNPLRGLLFTSEAHCDNGDYMSSPEYPRSSEEAEAFLARCREWIASRIEEAVRAAEPLARPGRLNTSLNCVFNGRPGRAKCTVLDHLGVALHAAQDFYSHSNWTDRPAEGPVSTENPPGLGAEGRAPWLDARGGAALPEGLISGCFQAVPEGLFCQGRARHAALNKDTGPIGADGALGPGDTPRGAINGNFERAVAAAIDDTRDRWAYFQERVYATYGQEDGARIVCAVRSDDYRRCR